jgi:hypothetical protein
MAAIETIISSLTLPVIVILAVWSLIWKGMALWKCGRNKHKAWFVALLITNTIGILPIIYILFFSKKK